jgi:tRNA (guanine-N7-)-methyltransferase
MIEEYLKKQKTRLAALRAEMEKLPSGDYVLELGCGHGHFLSALAERDKNAGIERNYIGVDKKTDRLRRGKKKSDRAGVPIHWIKADVADVLQLWPTTAENKKIKEIFVLFPDPWPKKKQMKHRFVNQEFLSALGKIVGSGSRFYFRSDHKGYCAAVRELLGKSADWQIDENIPWPRDMPTTVFEGYHRVYENIAARRKPYANAR